MNQQLVYTNAFISAVSLLILVWVIVKLLRLERIRKQFLVSETGKNLEDVLVDQNRKLTSLTTDVGQLEKKLNGLIGENQNDIKKIGFMRFNPFDDAGGNMSFALALLNDHNNGVVISSLHGRAGTRIYAKAVRSGKSESKLTTEELQAIKDAR